MVFSNGALTAFNIPYEITAISVLLTYWTDKVPAAAVVVACMALYAFVSSYSICSVLDANAYCLKSTKWVSRTLVWYVRILYVHFQDIPYAWIDDVYFCYHGGR